MFNKCVFCEYKLKPSLYCLRKYSRNFPSMKKWNLDVIGAGHVSCDFVGIYCHMTFHIPATADFNLNDVITIWHLIILTTSFGVRKLNFDYQ